MEEKIIIAAPKGKTRNALNAYFDKKAHVVGLNRESFIEDQALVIEDQRILLNDEDILEGALGAIVLDSGYMWPLPHLDPSKAEWKIYHNRYDEFLRNNREAESLWYSLLEIVNDRVPISINPPGAFAMEVMKPYAMNLLGEAGIEVAPFVATNDPSAVATFCTEHGAKTKRLLSLVPGNRNAVVVEQERIKELPLDEEPVLLQGITHPDLHRLTIVGSELVGRRPKNETLPPGLEGSFETIQTCLDSQLVELEVSIGKEGWQLTDFFISPKVDEWSEGELQLLAKSLWKKMEAVGEGRP